ncbi:MAG: DNA primase [Proteobacteria bacterium SG_bin5]|nr:toprim domain-containing protein [Sphingomonas sp.]OQW39552.1 MAG: DNA primase [Proteobacteria bacterium SG_bin5]
MSSAFEIARIAQEAKDRHNLSDIVGRYTTLKRRGTHELVGLCPFHDERTPSFEVNDAKAVYHCWGCGASGDAITFLMERCGMRFVDAVRSLDSDAFPIVSPEDRAKRQRLNREAAQERIDRARSIWSAARAPAGTAAEVYLRRARGLSLDLPATVRFAMTPRWRNMETGEVGRDVPAVVCAMQDHDAEVVAVQCVFLEAGGRRKYSRRRADGAPAKAKLTFGQTAGSAFRAAEGNTAELVLCEGPEDALTLAQELPGRAVWASCGTDLLWQVAIPPRFSLITLAGDNNEPGRAAVAKAAEVYQLHGLRVRTMFPDPQFKDFNDQLRGVC